MAPINSSCTCFRGCRARPTFLSAISRTGAAAGELANHPRRSGNDAALKKIKAAEQNDDAGFNSFFKTGWKRFYLKWYDASHPSAAAPVPANPCAAAIDPVGKSRDVRRAAARRQAEPAPRPLRRFDALPPGPGHAERRPLLHRSRRRTPQLARRRGRDLRRNLYPLGDQRQRQRPHHPVLRRRASDALPLDVGDQPLARPDDDDGRRVRPTRPATRLAWSASCSAFRT
jgi:hypothetical protein